VAQPTEVRDEMRLTSAEHTLTPLLLLPLLMVWMVLRIVRRALAPIPPRAVQAWGNKEENLRRLARERPDFLGRIEAGVPSRHHRPPAPRQHWPRAFFTNRGL
jgi:hypothetical protein